MLNLKQFSNNVFYIFEGFFIIIVDVETVPLTPNYGKLSDLTAIRCLVYTGVLPLQ